VIKKRKWKAAIEMVDSDAWVLADVDTPQVALQVTPQVSRLLEDLISDMPGAELRSNIRSKS
jgi:hypothetical protein